MIGAGDSLSVFVYRNPDLSEPGVAVRPDGRISTPLIDDLTAAGKTPTQLAHEIEDRLKKYIQDPTVTVIVRSFVGPSDRQIKVIGEATDPQAIPYRDGMSLLDVMIATKGLTKYAAGNRAVIIRRDAAGKQDDDPREPERPDEGRRHHQKRGYAAGRYPDHSAVLVLSVWVLSVLVLSVWRREEHRRG